MRKFRALSWLEDTENDHADEGTHKLRECGVDIQNAKVDTGKLAGGGDGPTVRTVFEMEEGGL